MKSFLEVQGFEVKENVNNQLDNQSTMELEMNGKAGSGKRKSHFNVKHFHITDLINHRPHQQEGSVNQMLPNGSHDCRPHDKATHRKEVPIVLQDHHESSLT
jgi:hypothetical protein